MQLRSATEVEKKIRKKQKFSVKGSVGTSKVGIFF